MSEKNSAVIVESEHIDDKNSSESVITISEPASSEKNASFDRRSSVWDHYEIVQEIKKGIKIQYAKCKHCGTKYRRDEKSKGSTGNMNTHLKVHPFITGKSPHQPDIGLSLKSQSMLKQPFSQDKFRKELIKWTVKRNQPYTEAESPEFVEMIQSLQPRAHTYSNNTVRRDVLKMFDKEQLDLKLQIEGVVAKLSFTHDAYTTPNRVSFLGIGCHWIFKDWIFCNTLVHLKEEHTGLNLSNAFHDSIGTFGINSTRILGITMDNASNNDTFMTHLEIISKAEGVSITSINNRVRCLAHVLNLAVQDFLKELKCSPPAQESLYAGDSTTSELKLQSSTPGLIKKVRELVKKVHLSTQKSEKLAEFCKIQGKSPLKLILDVATRWNSTFFMLARAEELKDSLYSLCSAEKDLRKYMIQEDDWLQLHGLKEILKKFENATKMMSVESKPTINTYIPTFDWLQKSLMEFISSNIENLKTGAEKALSKLNAYEPSFDENIIPFFGVVFDPTLKLQYFKDHGWDKKMIAKLKTAMISKFKAEYQQLTTGLPVNDKESTKEPTDHDYLEFLIKRPKNDVRQSEIEVYFKKPPECAQTHVLSWWKAHEMEFPNLSMMAKDYLAVKGTSVFMEREFSSGVDLVTPTRCRLNPESITKSLCLRHWWKLQNK